MTLSPLLAHVGHWWMYVLYAVPIVIVLGASVNALIAQRREDRRREAEGEG